jgi:hypothetical protein
MINSNSVVSTQFNLMQTVLYMSLAINHILAGLCLLLPDGTSAPSFACRNSEHFTERQSHSMTPLDLTASQGQHASISAFQIREFIRFRGLGNSDFYRIHHIHK